MQADIKKILDVIENNESFLIAAHSSPDGDALGSMLALGMAIASKGKTVHYYNRDNVPANLTFLPQSCHIQNTFPNKVDVGILVDCAERKRSSKVLAEYKGAKTWIAIDHHRLEKIDSEIKASFINPSAAATGIIIKDLLDVWGIKINQDIANCLYCAIVVDTGFFRYPNTDSSVFEFAKRLVDSGASPWLVARNIEENYPVSRLKLMGLSFSTAELHLNGRYSLIVVTQKMLKESGATIEDTDEFAVYPRSIGGVEVSALFRELGPNKIKVSLRSKDYVDVSSVAMRFGGGGHPRASGCLLENVSLNSAKEMILEAVEEHIKR